MLRPAHMYYTAFAVDSDFFETDVGSQTLTPMTNRTGNSSSLISLPVRGEKI